MTEAIRSYLLSVAAAAILTAVVQALLPDGPNRKITGYVGSLILLLVVIAPIAKIDTDHMARSISRIRTEFDEMQSGVQTGNKDLLEDIIKSRCEAYILDKAEAKGVKLQVSVEVNETVEFPYPVGVTLIGTVTQSQKSALSTDISENLGIPAERQEWKEN